MESELQEKIKRLEAENEKLKIACKDVWKVYNEYRGMYDEGRNILWGIECAFIDIIKFIEEASDDDKFP